MREGTEEPYQLAHITETEAKGTWARISVLLRLCTYVFIANRDHEQRHHGRKPVGQDFVPLFARLVARERVCYARKQVHGWWACSDQVSNFEQSSAIKIARAQ